jgi:GT2 family glycosyltransferase
MTSHQDSTESCRTDKVAVYTLLMRDEIETARVSLSAIIRQLDANTRLFVLLNDRGDARIARYFESQPNVEFLCLGANLGVAGGRNVLLRACLDWNADILVSYDPDLLPPRDYLRSMVDALASLSVTRKVGIVSAAVADANACRELWADDYARVLAAIQAGTCDHPFCFDPAVLGQWLGKNLPQRGAEVLHHIGIRDWQRHYLGTVRRSPPTFLCDDPTTRQCILDASDPVPVDTLPGGLHCYSASLARQLGGFDEAFNPFGYEDADFCIRALRAGYRNYLIPSVLVIHDICGRYNERDSVLHQGIRGKSQRLLSTRHIGGLSSLLNRGALLVEGSLRIVRSERFRALRGRAGRRNRWMLRAYVAGLLGLADPHRVATTARLRRTLGPGSPWTLRGGLKRLYWKLSPSLRAVLGRIVFPAVNSRGRSLVTVIVANRRRDRSLRESLQSVRDQLYHHFECIVVNGGGDGPRLLEAVAGDDRFRVVEGNGARSIADLWNLGLKAADGDLVTFLGAGDRLTPTSIWSRVLLYRFKDDGELAGAACEMDDRRAGGLTRGRRSADWIDFVSVTRDFPLSARTILAARSVLRGVGGFDAALPESTFDQDLWVRVLRQGPVLRNTGERGVLRAADPRGEQTPVSDHRAAILDRLSTSLNRLRMGAGGSPKLRQSPDDYRRMIAQARATCRRATVCHIERDEPGFDTAVTALDPALFRILTRHLDIDREIEDEIRNHQHLTGTPASTAAPVARRAIREAIFKRIEHAVKEECMPHVGDAVGIRRFQDRHHGQRCFIIGNGPSLNRHDLNLLTDEITFGVNGLFYKTEEMGFRPTYYVIEDSHVVADNLERINGFEVEHKFFPADYREKLDAGDNVTFFCMNTDFYRASGPNYRKPRFSLDAAQRLFCGQSVTYINLQLAFYMGFREVYLIGMDFSYAIPPSAIIDGLSITSTEDDPNHFHPDYFGKGKKWHDPQLDQVRKCYEHAKKVFEEHGRCIYNASKGGKLEVFERVEYDRLFETCVRV